MKKRTIAQKKRMLKELNMARGQVGLPELEGQTRICLKCGRPFFSMGNWNRICEGCTAIISKREESLESHRLSHR